MFIRSASVLRFMPTNRYIVHRRSQRATHDFSPKGASTSNSQLFLISRISPSELTVWTKIIHTMSSPGITDILILRRVVKERIGAKDWTQCPDLPPNTIKKSHSPALFFTCVMTKWLR